MLFCGQKQANLFCIIGAREFRKYIFGYNIFENVAKRQMSVGTFMFQKLADQSQKNQNLE